MQLNLVITILNRTREKFLRTIVKELEIPFSFTMLGNGTATRSQLDFYGLEATEKAVVSFVADAENTRGLFRKAKQRMFIDVPGNGIMMAIPMKSVGGGSTLAFLTNNAEHDDGAPDLTNVTHELVIVVCNHGCTDDVMDVARSAGAGGGTVLHAKGTGAALAKKFFGVTLAEEKEIILIASESRQRNGIMQAVASQCGPKTKTGAITSSLPVTEITGIRLAEAAGDAG